MSFRARVALFSAIAVGVALLIASVSAYLAAADSLKGEVDEDLKATAAQITGPVDRRGGDRGDRLRDEIVRDFLERAGITIFGPLPSGRFGGASAFVQVIDSDGNIVTVGGEPLVSEGTIYLPVGESSPAVAAGFHDATFDTVTVGDVPVRIYTERLAPGLALQLARPIDEVESALSDLAVKLGLGSLAGIALAAGLGLGVAEFALRPVRELTGSTEHVAQTRDLSVRISADRQDEIGRLARSFNTMLEALERSEQAQRQLIADASHELRTPITSLKTNLEVLADVDALSSEDRGRLIHDVVGQFDELNLLISDLVDAAREREPMEELEACDMELLTKAVAERIRRRYPWVTLNVSGGGFVTHGVSRRLERAVTNLLDNACKWSPDDGAVDVDVSDGRITVRDRGPGFDPVDLPHVFERFYRAASARGMPGSGLGLAIVAQVAETHGGSATARNHPGGGAEVTLTLPEV